MNDPEMLDAAEAALATLFEGGYEPPERDVEPAEAPTGDTPELTIDAQGRAHGPDGKFVPLAGDEGSAEEDVPAAVGIEEKAESAPEEEEAPEPDVLELEVDDPEVLSLLDKYDGDIVKALKAAAEAQSLIGRQGQELGDARREAEQLRAVQEQLEALQQQLQLQAAASQYNWEELIEESPEQAAQLAVELRNPVLLQRAVEAWGETNPFGAMMFMNQLSMQAAQEATVEQDEPETDLSGEVEALKRRLPDIQEHLPAIGKLAEERPLLRQALYEGDARDRVQALEDLYLLAKSRQATVDTSQAARRVILRAKAEADQAKADAAVVSATNTSATSAEKPKTNELLRSVLADALGDENFVIE